MSVRACLAFVQTVAVVGCSSAPSLRALDAPAALTSDRCDIAMSVLSAIIRPHDQLPLGLDRACVEEYAGLNGKIYVDARFARDGRMEPVGDPACQRDGYVIRFDSKAYVPSLTSDVVLLDIDRKDQMKIAFNATMEDRLWRQKRAQNVYSWSACFSSSGFASRGPNGWLAVPIAPSSSAR
jgi:hypothetical protein